MSGDEVRNGVALTNLDQPLFDGAEATKRDLVDYLDAVCDRIIPVLEGRPLSVVRVTRGQAPFMQKNVPKYTPPWVPTVSLWAETSQRDVSYALCNDRRTLLWLANQRAVEYHPTLMRADSWERPTHLVIDLDPPSAEAFPLAARAAQLVRQALTDTGLVGARSRPAERRACTCLSPSRAGRPPTLRRRPGRSRRVRSASTPHSPLPSSSGKTAPAKCSSIRPGPAERLSCRRTARAFARGCPCRSQLPGMSSTG